MFILAKFIKSKENILENYWLRYKIDKGRPRINNTLVRGRLGGSVG